MLTWATAHKGPIGHHATGVIAGLFIGLGFPIIGGFITGWVAVRQSISWLHKRDAVGNDMQEHIQAFVPSVIVGFLIRSFAL